MAISKERKEELIAQYVEWMNQSQAFFLTEYTGLAMKDFDNLRKKTREAGGEFHVIKNTLCKIAFEQAGLPLPDEYLEGSTAIAFAFENPPAMAKAVSDFSRDSDFLKIKVGFLESNPIKAEQIVLLAELPPLPVIQAKLLGTLLAPASQLARIFMEPARMVTSVINAYAEKEKASSAV